MESTSDLRIEKTANKSQGRSKAKVFDGNNKHLLNVIY
jgi:hypothetical protein